MAQDPRSAPASSRTPVTDFDGPALHFDVPGVRIGVAEYPEGPTGVTVVRFPPGSTAVCDVRGGSVATILAPREGWVDAVCLAGGSVYGLEAATGVSAQLLHERDYDTDWMNIAIVSGAAVFDFNRLRRNRSIYPDHALGRAAARTAREGWFPLGRHGAGACTTVGKWLGRPWELETAGQGGAFWADEHRRVAVFTVVNAVGCLVDRSGRAVRGHRHAATGERRRVGEVVDLSAPGAFDRLDAESRGNTTLTVVVTDVRLPRRELHQLARQVHTAMARAIEPFHTLHDGDVLWAVTTGRTDPGPRAGAELAHVASELAWDAVLASFA